MKNFLIKLVNIVANLAARLRAMASGLKPYAQLVQPAKKPVEKQAESVIELTVEGVDLDDEAIDDLLDKHFLMNEMIVGSSSGIVTFTIVTSNNINIVEAAIELGHRILYFLDATAVRWNDDFVSYGEISRRSDIDIEKIRLWAKGNPHISKANPIPNFPIPYGYLGIGVIHSPFWRWSEISDWLNINFHLGDNLIYPTNYQITEINYQLAIPTL